MTHVATLIASDALPGAVLDHVRENLPGTAEPRWLERGRAADILFTPAGAFDQRALSERLRSAIAGAPVDVVVQPSARRRKRLFVADMDSTIIGQECIDELADYVGKKAHVAAITERAMRGEIEFEPALRERVALLAGLPGSTIGDVIAKRVTLNPGARTLLATMRANGTHTCLVSGGFTAFVSRVAAMAGFDEFRGNELLTNADGTLAGRVREPILGRDAKLQALVELRDRLKLARDETLALGDGANDLAMIDEAGLGIAYHAKPAVAAAAHARIDHCDLDAILFAQGYSRDEFAGG